VGSTVIVFYVGATGVAVLCFVVGFLLGKSNLKSKIEQALAEAHGAFDTREFAMRQQLDEAFAEVARLRPLAEEYGRVQNRLRAEQSQYDQMKAKFDATLRGGSVEEPGKDAASNQKTAAPAESADEAVQKLLMSLEVTMNGSDERPRTSSEPPSVIEKQPPVVTEQRPVARVQSKAVVQPPPAPRPQPDAIVEAQPKTEPKAPKAPEPVGPAVDEWQEFARSLANLTRRNQ